MKEKIAVLSTGGFEKSYKFRGDFIRFVMDSGYELIICDRESNNPQYLGKIEETGAKCVTINCSKNSLSIFKDLLYTVRIFLFLIKDKPDYFFCYTTKAVIFGMIAAKLAFARRNIVMIAGAGYVFSPGVKISKWIRSVVKVLYKISLGKADRVIFQNPDDIKLFLEEGLVNEKKCYLINGSGVNINKFNYTVNELNGGIIFLMISRMIRLKGVEEYVEAAGTIKKKYSNTSFLLVGPLDPDHPEAIKKTYLDDYSKRGVIDYFGAVEDVKGYLDKCNVFVLPSYFGEGVPRTVLEAMATGRAIITTDSPGCRETVIDGVNGYKIPVRDKDALADTMEKIINHSDKLKSMGEESRKIVETKFDNRITIKEILNIILN